ncbi:MAG TPA: YetF domain-containing protein [Acidobacteriota bacterium]|nr:YetF domain-containing protein [Acidobacteriota bacterium]
MHTTWHDMFALGVPILEKVIRPLVVYIFLIVGLRLAGKRELAQLNPFDLVVLLTLSNTVQNAIIGEDNSLTGGLIGAATLLLVNYIVVRFLFTHEHLEHIVEGEPDALIEGGVLREERMKKELLTKAELETAAHRQGFSSLQDIERAVIEPGGTIFFVGKKPSPDDVQQKALVDRLDAIARQLVEIREKLPAQR